MNNSIYRVINTVVATIGTLVCIVSGFIPAPNGLLSDGTASLIQALPDSQKVWMFLVPSLLFIAAIVLVAAGRLGILALIAVLCGACVYAWMDLTYIRASMAFIGTLLNEIGIVITIAGVLLYVLGTPKEKRLKPENKIDRIDPLAELDAQAKAGAEPDPEAAVTGNQAGFYEGSEDTVVLEPLSRDTMEFRDTLVTALRELTGDMPEEDNAPEAEAAAEESPEEALAEMTPPDEDFGYTQVLWSSDEELAALLRADSEEIEEAAALEIPEKVTTEEIAAAAKEIDDNTVVFDASLEDLFIDEE